MQIQTNDIISRYSTEAKINSRKETIINPLQELLIDFNGKLPRTLQYWTMSSYCSGYDSEFNQLINSGLITEEQFHGVDIDPDVVNSNKKLGTKANFYNNDFYQAMVDARAEGNFNPGIINADTIYKGKKAAELTGKILYLLSRDKNEDTRLPIVFVNVVLKAHSNKVDDISQFISHLFNNKYYQLSAQEKEWKIKITHGYKNKRSNMQYLCIY